MQEISAESLAGMRSATIQELSLHLHGPKPTSSKEFSSDADSQSTLVRGMASVLTEILRGFL